MFWGILIAFGVVALLVVLLVMLVGEVLKGIVAALFATDREASSPTEAATIAGLGVVGFLAAVVIGSVGLPAWWVPLVLWPVGFSIVRHRAPLKETPAQRAVREATERKQAEQEEKRAAARKVVAERKRVDSFTKDGLALLQRANAAVDEVRATEAARDGWLCEPTDFDFSADLALISGALLRARRIEKVVERTKKIPDPSPDDVAMLRDAEKAVKTLRAEAKSRVRIIDDCVKQASEIDRLLAEERRQQEVDRQREAARRQLAAELFVAGVRTPTRDSETADAIAARVQAFRELKNIVDEKVLREIEGGGSNPVYGLFAQVRRVLSF
jgi:hypothetical protein